MSKKIIHHKEILYGFEQDFKDIEIAIKLADSLHKEEQGSNIGLMSRGELLAVICRDWTRTQS